MPTYRFEVESQGRSRQGYLTAGTPREARDRLRSQRLRILSLQENCETSLGILRWLRRWKVRDTVTEFARHLAALIRSGVPVEEALRTLGESQKGPLETVFRAVGERVRGGSTLDEALSEHGNVFDPIFISLCRVGHATGALDVVLKRLAEYRQREGRIRRRVVSALTYPAILIGIGVCVVLFLTTSVVPQILDVLRSAGRPLPLPTTLLEAATGALTTYWWVGCLLLGCGVLAFCLLRRLPQTRLFLDRVAYRIPHLGGIWLRDSVAKLGHVLSTLLGSGLPLLDSLRLAKGVSQNTVLVRTLEDCEENLLAGRPISDALRDSGVFPHVAIQMVQLGERTGELEELLAEMAQTYDEEVEVALGRMTTVLEPALVVLMAFVVGFIVFAILLPILEAASIG